MRKVSIILLTASFMMLGIGILRGEAATVLSTACGACSHVCKMDVDVFRTPNHAECIRCGDCIQTCPHQAISKTFSLKSMDERKANKYEKNN